MKKEPMDYQKLFCESRGITIVKGATFPTSRSSEFPMKVVEKSSGQLKFADVLAYVTMSANYEDLFIYKRDNHPFDTRHIYTSQSDMYIDLLDDLKFGRLDGMVIGMSEAVIDWVAWEFLYEIWSKNKNQ